MREALYFRLHTRFCRRQSREAFHVKARRTIKFQGRNVHYGAGNISLQSLQGAFREIFPGCLRAVFFLAYLETLHSISQSQAGWHLLNGALLVNRMKRNLRSSMLVLSMGIGLLLGDYQNTTGTELARDTTV